VLINELYMFHIRALRNVLYLYDKPTHAHLQIFSITYYYGEENKM